MRASLLFTDESNKFMNRLLYEEIPVRIQRIVNLYDLKLSNKECRLISMLLCDISGRSLSTDDMKKVKSLNKVTKEKLSKILMKLDSAVISDVALDILAEVNKDNEVYSSLQSVFNRSLICLNGRRQHMLKILGQEIDITNSEEEFFLAHKPEKRRSKYKMPSVVELEELRSGRIVEDVESKLVEKALSDTSKGVVDKVDGAKNVETVRTVFLEPFRDKDGKASFRIDLAMLKDNSVVGSGSDVKNVKKYVGDDGQVFDFPKFRLRHNLKGEKKLGSILQQSLETTGVTGKVFDCVEVPTADGKTELVLLAVKEYGISGNSSPYREESSSRKTSTLKDVKAVVSCTMQNADRYLAVNREMESPVFAKLQEYQDHNMEVILENISRLQREKDQLKPNVVEVPVASAGVRKNPLDYKLQEYEECERKIESKVNKKRKSEGLPEYKEYEIRIEPKINEKRKVGASPVVSDFKSKQLAEERLCCTIL